MVVEGVRRTGLLNLAVVDEARSMTPVSSESDRFSGGVSFLLRALMSSARLLMLLLAGSTIRPFICLAGDNSR